MYLQNKQENRGGAHVASPKPNSDLEFPERDKSVFSVKNILPSTVSLPLSLRRRVVVRFTWEVSDSLPKWKGKGALCSHVMTCSSFYIAKLPLSSAFETEGYACDSWVVICLS